MTDTSPEHRWHCLLHVPTMKNKILSQAANRRKKERQQTTSNISGLLGFNES
jgi:hypothetical protein